MFETLWRPNEHLYGYEAREATKPRLGQHPTSIELIAKHRKLQLLIRFIPTAHIDAVTCDF